MSISDGDHDGNLDPNGSLSVHCSREDLLVALQAADSIVPSSSAKPILTNLQLTASADSLVVAATDQQIGLRAVLRRLQVHSAGRLILPARQMVAMLKESKSPTVSLEADTEASGQVRLELADGRYQLPAVVGESFPEVSGFPAGVQSIAIDGQSLEKMIRRVAFAVDRDRTSAVLSGVQISVAEDALMMVATDGKVLSEGVLRGQGFGDQAFSAIVPAATITHLNRILASASPRSVELAVSNKLIFLRVVVDSGEVGGAGSIQVELTSRLVEGTYPAYRNALPSSPQQTLTFRSDELISAVRRTALMAAGAARAIILEADGEQAMFSNLNRSGGSARIPIACRSDGPALRIGLNAAYTAEVLKAIEGEEITLECNGPGRGIIIREPNMTFLVMPITLPN